MASRAGLSGLALAEIAGGVLLAWSGIQNQSLTNTLRPIIGGKAPPAGPAGDPGTVVGSGGSTSPYAGAVGGNPPTGAALTAIKAYATSLLALHGWPGQFSSFNSIVMAESGWNDHALNPSGAWGIAQALGHGTAATDAGNGHNEYGNYGTSDAVCKLANGGNGEAQVQWMLNYIGQAYNSPDQAWAFHQAHGYY